MEDRIRAYVLDEIIAMRGENEGDIIPHLVVVTAEAAIKADDEIELEDNTTHIVRFVLQNPECTPVDGDQWCLEIGDDSISLLTEPDAPALMGADLSSAVAWCNELA